MRVAQVGVPSRPAFGANRRRVVALTVLACLALLGLAVAASAALDRPLSDFTREPQNVLRSPVYIGFFAILAMLVWWSAATIAFFAAAVARAERREFLVLGVVIAFLVMDDAFQLHEVVLPRLGIDQLVVYGAYALGFAALLVVGRHFVARHDTGLFVAALAFLAVSVGMDVVQDVAPAYHSRPVEQAAKIVGLGLLVVFTAGAAADALRAATPRPERPSRARAGEDRPRERSPVASRGSGGRA